MMEKLDMGIDLTYIPIGWVSVIVGWDGVLQQVGSQIQDDRSHGGVGGLHPIVAGEGEVGHADLWIQVVGLGHDVPPHGGHDVEVRYELSPKGGELGNDEEWSAEHTI